MLYRMRVPRRLPPLLSRPHPLRVAGAPAAPRLASTFPTDAIPASLSASSASNTKQDAAKEDAKRLTGYLYFDSLFPIKLGMWDIRSLVAQMEKEPLLDSLKSLCPPDSALSARVEDVTPREKDGGAFVKFSYIPPETPYEESERTPEEQKALEDRCKEILEKEAQDAVAVRGYKPWFVMGESRVFLVKGKPWLEDMNRFPNGKIRVEFEGPEIPQEELYDVFRPFGRIHNIYPQPPSSKDTPRFANVTFISLRSAAAARNCLHNAVIPSTLPIPNPPPPTVLRILYADREQAHWFRDWFTSHPRIVIPIVVALLGGLSWAVFDPIRAFFIRQKVEGTWDSEQWKLLTWLKKETLGRLGFAAVKANVTTGIEREREEAKAQLTTWLKDTPDTFIIVTGPRGSGKTALVDEVVAESKNVLTIDCLEISKNGRSDTKLVSELAGAVGYWPQFVLAASLNNLIDLASVGLIGQKAGFSASLDAQLKQILEVTSGALKGLANDFHARTLRARKKAEAAKKDPEEREAIVKQIETTGVKDGRLDAVAGNGAMSELGGGIEKPHPHQGPAHIIGPSTAAEIKEITQPLQVDESCPSERIGGLPIVVLKGFATKGEAKQEVLWDVLAEWAAVLVENQVAHVIFTSDSVTLTKPLAKALPNKPFSSIQLNDASPESAIQYVESKLSEGGATVSLSDADRPHISKLGGRQTDLELLVQKVRAGLRLDEAVDDLIAKNATELRKSFFGDDDEEAKGLKWTREQAYTLTKGLSKHDELKYAEVLVNSPFKSDDAPLRALENAEMISVHHREGRPSVIRPGKPVYRSAFQYLLSDPVFAASVEFQNNAAATSSATADLNSASKALIELTQLFGGNGRWVFGGSSTVPKEIEVRVSALLAKMREAETKLEKLEQEKAEILKVLASAV
ncbi:hypothetical protein T439DRAFT_313608 [Meredithblackwellia eburnea MCA 4105]